MALIIRPLPDEAKSIPFKEFGAVLEAEGSLVILNIVQ
jgi:hypothetical protein